MSQYDKSNIYVHITYIHSYVMLRTQFYLKELIKFLSDIFQIPSAYRRPLIYQYNISTSSVFTKGTAFHVRVLIRQNATAFSEVCYYCH